jgi:hypothetical protein
MVELVIGPQNPVLLAKVIIPPAPPSPENWLLRFAFLRLSMGTHRTHG